MNNRLLTDPAEIKSFNG